ncbi:MAG: S9 family peptidase [Herpetosiphon sp.]
MTTHRTLTMDDVLALENINDVQISPDGKHVAYVVAQSSTDAECKLVASTIWLAPTDGSSEPRRWTYGSHADSFPRWSPDGRNLIFLSDREKSDTQQIYLMNATGGEARRLTDAGAGVQSIRWSPDGRRIAFLAIDGDTDEEKQRKEAKDDAQHLDHDYKFTRLWVMDVDAGAPKAITPPRYQVTSYAWLGNDAWVATTSPTPKLDEFNTSSPVLRLREADGEAEVIWQGPHQANSVTTSADGRLLAWTHAGGDIHGWVSEVWVQQNAAAPTRILDNLDGSISSLNWIPGTTMLALSATTHTRSSLLQLPATGGPPQTLLKDRVLLEGVGDRSGISITADGRRYAALIGDGTHPFDVWVGEMGEPPRQLTHHNQHLAAVALGRTETIRWEAPDGLEIEGILIYPSGYERGQRYPMVLQYHGGPNWQWREHCMASWHDWGQSLAARGYAVLLPNPRGSTGRGVAFASANVRAWGVGDLGDVLAGVDYVVSKGIADPERLGVGGWSYGGFLTAWTIGHTNRFKAAIVGAGVTNLISFQAADIPSWLPKTQMTATHWEDQAIYLRCSPISYVGNVTTPTLLLHGADDQRVRVGQGFELYHALRHRQIPCEMVTYPREGHPIMERHHQRDLLTRVGEWYDRYLK